MGRNFPFGWIIALAMVVGTLSCSDSHEGEDDGPGALRPRDADNDGINDAVDDSDGDGIPDSEDDDLDGDGIPNDEDDDNSGGGDDGSGANGSAGSSAGGGSVPNASLPAFPGAGTSDAGDPLPNGMLCDSVAGPDIPITVQQGKCFYDKNDPNNPNVAATLEQVLECVEDTNTIHLRLTFSPWFVDNTYGANAIGWPRRHGHCDGHCWDDLVKSDHAEFILTDGAGNTVLQIKLDYVSVDASAPSGYSSLGVTGGDGAVVVGDASSVVKWSTSIVRNLNERGLEEYIPDSPATDADYTPNPDAPEWDFRVVYEVWIDASIFSNGGFGGATIEYVHASPAKTATDTIETTPGDCPPCAEDNDPDTFCGEGGHGGGGGTGGNGGTGGSGCIDNDPDTFCGEGGSSGGGEPTFCTEHPDDPACMVD